MAFQLRMQRLRESSKNAQHNTATSPQLFVPHIPASLTTSPIVRFKRRAAKYHYSLSRAKDAKPAARNRFGARPARLLRSKIFACPLRQVPHGRRCHDAASSRRGDTRCWLDYSLVITDVPRRRRRRRHVSAHGAHADAISSRRSLPSIVAAGCAMMMNELIRSRLSAFLSSLFSCLAVARCQCYESILCFRE